MFYENEQVIWTSDKLKRKERTKKGGLLLSYIKATYQRPNLRDKKDIVSVPYLTVFRFLPYNLLRILKSYGIASFSLKTSLNIAGDRSCRYL